MRNDADWQLAPFGQTAKGAAGQLFFFGTMLGLK
jgi:hypothetical protein